jgi:WD40 repeat protein
MNNHHHQQSNGTNNNITQQQDLSNGNTTTSASASASAADTNNDTYTYLNDTRINVDDNDIAERISLDDDMSHRNEVEMNELIDDIDDITKNMTTEHEHGHEHEHQHEDEHGQEQDVSDSDVIEDNSIVGFYQHNDSIYCVATYDDYAVTGDGHENHCRAYVWSIVDGRMIQELQAVHTDTIIDIKFSADGRLLATASMDSTIHVYDVTHDFKHLHTLQGPSAEIEFLLFHPHGHVVAAGSSDSTVWMYNADTGDMMHVFTGHLGSVLCGTWSTDGKLLITGSDDGTVYIWNPKTGQPKYPKITHDTPITSITSHPYESLIACGTANGIIQVINTDTGHVVSTYSNAQSTESGGIEGKHTACY